MLSREPTSPLRKTHTAQASVNPRLYLGRIRADRQKTHRRRRPLIQAEPCDSASASSRCSSPCSRRLVPCSALGAGIVARPLGAVAPPRRRQGRQSRRRVPLAPLRRNVGALLASRIAEGVVFSSVVVRSGGLVEPGRRRRRIAPSCLLFGRQPNCGKKRAGEKHQSAAGRHVGAPKSEHEGAILLRRRPAQQVRHGDDDGKKSDAFGDP